MGSEQRIIIKVSGSKRNWQEALTECKKFAADLAEKTGREVTVLESIDSNWSKNSTEVWCGHTYSIKEKKVRAELGHYIETGENKSFREGEEKT